MSCGARSQRQDSVTGFGIGALKPACLAGTRAAASRLAELGCSDREIMAITGHTTSKEVNRYTKGARQRVLAASALRKMSGGRHLKAV